jgi:hypothetical protein
MKRTSNFPFLPAAKISGQVVDDGGNKYTSTVDKMSSDIFNSQSSQFSVDLGSFKGIDFSAAFPLLEVGAVAHAVMNQVDDEDALAILSSSSEDDASCTGISEDKLSSSSSSSAADEEDEEELGNFLWDDLAGFDSTMNDLADLCPA